MGVDMIAVMSAKKTYPDEESERVRALLRELLERDFQGNQSQAARVLGLTQSMINLVINGQRNPGTEVLDALSEYTGRAGDNIRGRLPRYRDLPGWEEALPEAMKMFRRVPPAAFEAVGNLMGQAPPGELTPLVIGTLAQAWYSNAPDEARIAARAARADAEMAAEDAEAEREIAERLPHVPPLPPKRST